MAEEGVGAPPEVKNAIDVRTTLPQSEQQIDPYNVSGGVDEQGNAKAIDYDRLIQQFGVQKLTEEHLERFEQVTGKKPHRLMRRKLFFSHRDFDKLLDVYEKHGTFMLYTGRGPSSGSMHLGHTVPFLFTKQIQEMFDVPLVIMLTDDEKYLYTRQKNDGRQEKGKAVEDFLDFAHQNIKDIIALGFDPKKTFIYTDYEYVGGHFYWNVSEFESLVTLSQATGAFGHKGETNIGMVAYAAKQCVAAFPSSYPELFGYANYSHINPDPKGLRRHKALADIPCLIPCAIDQEPYFRMVRDRCPRMTHPHPKTTLILSKFLTALQGPGGKMSASDANSAIFMSDTANQIKKKINSHAFSGGRETLEEHRQYGGNPDIDVAYTYLSYFLEDDAELEDLATRYRSGDLLTGDMKKRCIEELQKFVTSFQEKRSQVTDEVMREFMKPRKLEFKGNPNPTHPMSEVKSEANGPAEKVVREDGKLTKGQRKEQKLAEKKREKEEQKLAERPKAESAEAA
ncbi:Tryptophan--tRNA ligase, cytoplasmic [Fulvia fulva]|uniref:Tryptophan--tRNA ligase, cytoplasmic n=1 Tax=Passalora fulva TaxID=5499 RepID=A0A9Q8PHW3_PASFU|nr:Tryptophan--tRNA ligase, cytoplasmic [Fulvia fulva]KAK4626508.1 Tryptophan--tRNA ligase, cytoplasmic [Fulvia fulva]KAK4627754.1 Tryptophan--tRNA ligase, cytoplasmic [Fulvia fulva]UJO22770.1 Tryptophan--tRNA ligase, cytoplasmic [Fulvia fulva]WPV14384.1 Tryptophan--tRNA ligase, cytoplasmic [Fulvia fulva]WPV28301.1 Tryptophan--tRNA ligase, cytoplasmic [Fulvia fulva]